MSPNRLSFSSETFAGISTRRLPAAIDAWGLLFAQGVSPSTWISSMPVALVNRHPGCSRTCSSPCCCAESCATSRAMSRARTSRGSATGRRGAAGPAGCGYRARRPGRRCRCLPRRGRRRQLREEVLCDRFGRSQGPSDQEEPEEQRARTEPDGPRTAQAEAPSDSPLDPARARAEARPLHPRAGGRLLARSVAARATGPGDTSCAAAGRLDPRGRALQGPAGPEPRAARAGPVAVWPIRPGSRSPPSAATSRWRPCPSPRPCHALRTGSGPGVARRRRA